ncbi:fatty-acid amide hydrolase 2-B-like protein [Dinothrombium tinctorium]|nr:fatty-acid amide hydrolase 2-B-like protein [Dinothrombium tinctorium]
MSFETSNFLFGRTNNPYDLALIPGGSSGGEGALISSAGSIIGVGTDLGGSIRLPAYFCGIFGHKSSNDVVSRDGIFSLKVPELESLLAVGPICRYATDLKPLLKAMAKDEISRLPKIDSVVDLSKIRIFYMLENENALNTSVSCETKDAILKVVSHFEQTYKVQCTKVDVKKMSDGFNFFLATMAKATSSSSSSPFDGGEFNLPLEILRKLLGRSSHVASVLSLFVYVTIFSLFSKTNLDESKELKKQLIDIFGDDGVFLYPCYPNINVKHDTPTLLWHNLSYTTVFNLMNLPVTQCAFGLNKNGLPVGFQVAANELNDHLTIAVAEEIEKVFGGWVPPFIIKNQPK